MQCVVRPDRGDATDDAMVFGQYPSQQVSDRAVLDVDADLESRPVRAGRQRNVDAIQHVLPDTTRANLAGPAD